MLPHETRRFWILEARDLVKGLAKDPGHDITAAVVPATQDRSATVKVWFDMMGAILRQDDTRETDERF